MANSPPPDPDLDPGASPSAPGRLGTRRINKTPLLIAFGLVIAFFVMVAYVANLRASRSRNANPEPTTSAAAEADNIIPKNPGWAKPQDPALPAPVLTPPPLASSTPIVSAPPKDMTRINAIQSALGSKIGVAGFDSADLSRSGNGSNAAPSAAHEDPLTTRMNLMRSLLQPASTTPATSPVASTGEEGRGGDAALAATARDITGLGQFNSTDPRRWKTTATIENPGKFILRTGAIIPGVLISGVQSDLPGTIIAQASQNVYDTPTGRFLLIPQGSKLIGAYTSDVGFGKDRLFIAWQRIVYPDGRAMDLGAQPGTDGRGMAGFADKVNHHYLRTFGSAILMSVVTGAISYTQERSQNSNVSNSNGLQGTNTNTLSGSLSQSLGTVFGNVIAKMIEKNLDIAPTIKIRPGYRFNILVVKDFELYPYKAYSYPKSNRDKKP